jgi:DEAD/DEAH box helicase domain-containing protein
LGVESTSIERFLVYLQEKYPGRIVHIKRIPPREAKYAYLSESIHPLLANKLEELGISKLYTHQVEAISKVLAGSHVVVTASTASGKTLCYNLPVLHVQLTSPGKTALYVYPTKALAQDQLRKLNAFELPGRSRFGLYDGDTPPKERLSVRKNCCTVLTNPDTLHMAILPNHSNWAEFFRNLAFVVIDELHNYRGVFGSHVANIIRRLRRVCRFYGSVPQFIACSATINEPAQVMEELTGVKPEVVGNDGSPQGERWLVFWNPPCLVDGKRRSANLEAAMLLADLARHGIRSIVFTKTRVATELVYKYAVEQLREMPAIASRLMPYRAGYTPEQRRETERKLFDGLLLGVTATTALELGIDVGDLDACVLTGYPGTIADTWQQMGRAGRGCGPSLAILISLDNPVDQFIVQNPEYLFNTSNERTILNPKNPYILAEHMRCAVYEIPFSDFDFPLFGITSPRILEVLSSQSKEVVHTSRYWSWIGSGYPAANVSIRSSGGCGYCIRDLANPEVVLGTVEEATAFQTLHEGAVYLHLGESYIVEYLDIEKRCAYVRRKKVDYYTIPRTETNISIDEEFQNRRLGCSVLHFGRVLVTSRVTGYWKKQVMTETCLGEFDLELPPQSYDTQAVWLSLDFPPSKEVQIELGMSMRSCDVQAKWFGMYSRLSQEASNRWFGGLHAFEHALVGVLPLCAMCDVVDIGGVSSPMHPQIGAPVIFIFDAHPGGVGLSEAAYARADELVRMAYSIVSRCPCKNGCPSCVQSPRCGSNNFPLDKQLAVLLIASLTV